LDSSNAVARDRQQCAKYGYSINPKRINTIIILWLLTSSSNAWDSAPRLGEKLKAYLNNQGEIMDALAFNTKKFVRSSLLSIIFYSLIVVTSSVMIVKAANASGNVSFATLASAGLCKDIPWPSGDSALISCVVGGVAGGTGAFGGYINCNSVYYFGCYIEVTSGPGQDFTSYIITTRLGCPTNSTQTGSNACTCNDPYVPDSTGTSCIQGQYTLSLQTVSEMEPSDKTTDDSVTVIAKVVDQNQQPKAGVTVSINVDVVANSGGHNHDDGRHVAPYTGTLDTTTGVTGSDGTFTFTFTAPEVSGTHTFTATCVQPTCTNNPATTHIDVKVDGLAPIPSSVFYRFITPNADTNHPDNHNLQPAASAQLAAIAMAYYKATYLLKDGWLPNVMLNDASLEWGGILDCFLTCKGTSVPWGPDHKEHRRGSVVDIRARLPAVNDPNNPQADTLLYAQEFIKAAKKKGADPYPEGSHYHLRLFGIPE
jgi:hypothetical protein